MMPSEEYNQGDGNKDWYIHVLNSTFLLWMCRFIIVIYNWLIMLFYNFFYDFGNEKLTFHNHHVKNKLNNTNIKYGFEKYIYYQY